MPEYEYPGVYVEEAGSPKPIDGVPTNGGAALTGADGPQFVRRVVIGGAVLTGLAILLTAIKRDVVFQLFAMPGGVESILALFGSALILNIWRALVEWRRRKAGRAPFEYGKVALGVAVLVLATSAALLACLLLWGASLLVAPDLSRDFLTATLNVFVGCFLIRLAAGALRDLLVLVQAARGEP